MTSDDRGRTDHLGMLIEMMTRRGSLDLPHPYRGFWYSMSIRIREVTRVTLMKTCCGAMKGWRGRFDRDNVLLDGPVNDYTNNT